MTPHRPGPIQKRDLSTSLRRGERGKLTIRTEAKLTHDLNLTLTKISEIYTSNKSANRRHLSTDAKEQRLNLQPRGGNRMVKVGIRRRIKVTSMPVTPNNTFLSPVNSVQNSPKLAKSHFPSLFQAAEFFDSMSKPLTSAQAFDTFQDFLSEHEKKEIFSFQSVFFLGLKAAKRGNCLESKFDDERGDYRVTLWDHFGYRYETIQVLGKGSFGQVVRCFDHQKQEFCALKIIRNKPRFHQQAKVEISILEHIRTKDAKATHQIVHLIEHFTFRGHICMSFEVLSLNLYQFLKQNQFRGVSETLIRTFAGQMLNALRFLRKEKIIHCDVKPENVLLKKPDHSSVTLIDFGSACFESAKLYTYVQSRFYRAPEVILGLDYTCSIDMWSLGCLLAELRIGLPLFPGRNEADQLFSIIEIRGLPPGSILENSPKTRLFFDSENRLRVSKEMENRHPGRLSLREVVSNASAELVDLIESKV